MIRLSFISIICICAFNHFTITAGSIYEFNTLVQNPAWKSLTKHQLINKLTFFDNDLNKELQIFTLDTLFPNGLHADIVTEQNFFDKVWQFHLLLSIYYAMELLPISKIMLDFWSFCQDSNNWVWKPFCQKSFVEKYLELYVEIKKMHGSLLYFSNIIYLSTGINKKLTNKVHDALKIYEEIKENNDLKQDDIIEKLKLANREIKRFFEIHVYPPHIEAFVEGHIMLKSFNDENIKRHNTLQENSSTFEEKLSASISSLSQSNSKYGFIYDSKTLAVSVSLPVTDILLKSLGGLSV